MYIYQLTYNIHEQCVTDCLQTMSISISYTLNTKLKSQLLLHIKLKLISKLFLNILIKIENTKHPDFFEYH